MCARDAKSCQLLRYTCQLCLGEQNLVGPDAKFKLGYEVEKPLWRWDE